MQEGIEATYPSPRWSMEILDCAMPMTFDTYSRCSFNCLYCFSYYQKSHSCGGYLEGIVKSVNVEKVKRLFTNCLADKPTTTAEKQFYPYIKAKKVMQWGGLADQFDLYEKKYGVTLELMKFFDEIDYPLSFSTKSVWWTEDERYMALMRKHPHNWHVKVSIITLDEKKARAIEKGCPTPEERIQALARLNYAGVPTTLRLRPYIIGVSGDWRELIKRCANVGIISVSSEFFCLEARANAALMDRYRHMSEGCGYDIHAFYRANSQGSGYRRLTRKIKLPIYLEMKALCKTYGIRLAISDAHCRDLNDSCNCCGVPPEWNSQCANFQGAILIAKRKGTVTWSEFEEEITRLFGGFRWIAAEQFNTGSNRNRAVFDQTTMAEWIKYLWNNPEKLNSPQGAYGGILKAIGRDIEGNSVYALGVGNHGGK